MRFTRISFVLALLSLCATIATAGVITFNASGSNNSWPFDEFYGANNYSQLYNGAKFGTGPVSISGVTFTLGTASTYPIHATYGLFLLMSSTAFPLWDPQANINNYISPGAETVFSGARATTFNQDGDKLKFSFLTPFTFDPSTGNNLALNFYFTSNSGCFGCGFVAGDSADMSRSYMNGGSGGTDMVGHAFYGLQTDFTVQDVSGVPEPGTFVPLLSGLLGLGGLAYVRRRTCSG